MKSMMITGLLFMALSFIKAKANVSMKSFQCPTEFEGVVTEVTDVEKRDHSLAKVRVTFKNEVPVRGSNFAEKTVQILKYGMLQVETGSLYSVSLRDNKVCDIRQI